jgi:Na+/H+ antiporter NhaD/arsenite permease-like protein
LGKIPGLRIDRAGIALVGATLTVVTGTLSLADGVRAVDYETILLLFGMMVVVAFLRLSGFFLRLSRWTLKRFRTPHSLLAMTIGLSGVLSAFLVNDIVCLALTPLLIHLARHLQINPLPHLIGLATAANIGSTATITGNPQNMIIGGLSHIAYGRFAAKLGPVAAVGLLVDFIVIAVVYRGLLAQPAMEDVRLRRQSRHHRQLKSRPHAWLLWKSVTVTAAAVLLFFLGAPVGLSPTRLHQLRTLFRQGWNRFHGEEQAAIA